LHIHIFVVIAKNKSSSEFYVFIAVK